MTDVQGTPPKAHFIRNDQNEIKKTSAKQLTHSKGKAKKRIGFDSLGDSDKLHLIACKEFKNDKKATNLTTKPSGSFRWAVIKINEKGNEKWIKVNKASFNKRFGKDLKNSKEIQAFINANFSTSDENDTPFYQLVAAIIDKNPKSNIKKKVYDSPPTRASS